MSPANVPDALRDAHRALNDTAPELPAGHAERAAELLAGVELPALDLGAAA